MATTITTAAETCTNFAFVVFHAVDGRRSFKDGDRPTERDDDADTGVDDDSGRNHVHCYE